MPQVQRTTQANEDLVEIWGYIARDSFRAADRLLETIEEKCQLLAEFPQMGRQRDELAPGLRSFGVGAYLIFYRIIEDGIEVIRVLHGARHLERIFNP
jgi:toxin ParE1/3/4